MKLTDRQRQALRTDRHVFVEAGAGSGKTAILVERFAAIVRENPGIDLQSIVAFTFTQKAAQEMLERLQLPGARVSTIHGFCHRLLMRYPKEAGIGADFLVLEKHRSAHLMHEAISSALDQLGENADVVAYLTKRSMARLRRDLLFLFGRNEILPSAEGQDVLGKNLLSIFGHAKRRYAELKSELNAVDYGDLVTKALRLLDAVDEPIKFLMVDEFQDTDPEQWKLIQRLSRNGNLFVVGDIKQAIYSFRGADPSQYGAVKKRFDGEVVKLSDNFRSQAPVLDFVNPFFEKLFFEGDSLSIDYHWLDGRRAESDGAVEFRVLEPGGTAEEIQAIAEWIRKKNLTLCDAALLFRTKARMEAFRSGLMEAGIPAEICVEKSAVQDEDVVDTYALARALLTPNSETAWAAVLTSMFFNWSDDWLFEWRRGERRRPSVIDGWIRLVNVIGLWRTLMRAFDETKTARSEAARKFLARIRSLERDMLAGHLEPLAALELLFAQGAAGEGETRVSDENSVKLLTIHGAKGLEFPAVIVPECGKNFNFSQSDSIVISRQKGLGLSRSEGENPLRKEILEELKKTVIEEEKRLFYVACTRARDFLLLVGSRKPERKKPQSPTSYLDFLDLAGHF